MPHGAAAGVPAVVPAIVPVPAVQQLYAAGARLRLVPHQQLLHELAGRHPG